MCGIAGYINFENDKLVDENILKDMTRIFEISIVFVQLSKIINKRRIKKLNFFIFI